MERVRFSNIYFDQNLKEVIKEIPQVKFQLLKVWRPYFFKWCEFGQAQNMFKNGEEVNTFRKGTLPPQNQFNVDLNFEKKEVKREDN